MSDKKTSIQQLKDTVEEFVSERNWQTFHDPKNLSMALAVEAAELMEHFIWASSDQAYEQLKEHRDDIEDEFADVMMVCLAFANAAQVNIVDALEKKMKKVREKYPIDKVKDQDVSAIKKVKKSYRL